MDLDNILLLEFTKYFYMFIILFICFVGIDYFYIKNEEV